MFSALISRLTGKSAPAPDPELDAQFAIVALLVRLAKADSNYAFEEIAEIDRIIARTWELNPVEAMKLRAQAERLEAGAPAAGEPETDTLTRLVQDHTPYRERKALYDALWDVSLADARLHATERSFLDQAAAALAIDARDVAAIATRHGETGGEAGGGAGGETDGTPDSAASGETGGDTGGETGKDRDAKSP